MRALRLAKNKLIATIQIVKHLGHSNTSRVIPKAQNWTVFYLLKSISPLEWLKENEQSTSKVMSHLMGSRMARSRPRPPTSNKLSDIIGESDLLKCITIEVAWLSKHELLETLKPLLMFRFSKFDLWRWGWFPIMARMFLSHFLGPGCHTSD